METTKTIWAIDPSHSEIGFKVKHLVVSNLRGTFGEYEASIYTTGDDFTNAAITFSLHTASINTRNEQRDAHLKAADFFDTESFNEIRFVANGFEKLDKEGRYEMYGDLTIKGITHRIKLDVEFGGMVKDPWGNVKAVFAVTGKINRNDFGLSFNAVLETGGLLLSEDVWINCDLQLVKVEH
jgi:polyisoprenoid-binding protein YceI